MNFRPAVMNADAAIYSPAVLFIRSWHWCYIKSPPPHSATLYTDASNDWISAVCLALFIPL